MDAEVRISRKFCENVISRSASSSEGNPTLDAPLPDNGHDIRMWLKDAGHDSSQLDPIELLLVSKEDAALITELAKRKFRAEPARFSGEPLQRQADLTSTEASSADFTIHLHLYLSITAVDAEQWIRETRPKHVTRNSRLVPAKTPLRLQLQFYYPMQSDNSFVLFLQLSIRARHSQSTSSPP
ncbi:MAG: hypothetical protein IT457_17535 [Planctomycetes bacterium]|nr:hypothetical protein [Planctomycetota bacterium]